MSNLFIAWLAAIGLLCFYRVQFGKLTRVVLLEFQRGVLYKRGLAVRDVGPGGHWVWAGTEFLLYADIRPRSIADEHQVVSLRDGGTAVYGFLAKAQITDVRKALYAARLYDQVPQFILLRVARLALNSVSVLELTGRERVVSQIVADARRRLQSVGWELLTFELTNLAVVDNGPAREESAQSQARTDRTLVGKPN